MAAGLGFEPRQHESESWVLPLHNPATRQPNTTCPTDSLIICQYPQNVNTFFAIFIIFTFFQIFAGWELNVRK